MYFRTMASCFHFNAYGVGSEAQSDMTKFEAIIAMFALSMTPLSHEVWSPASSASLLRDSNSRPPYLRPLALTPRLCTIHTMASVKKRTNLPLNRTRGSLVQSAVLDLGRKANYAGTWKILMEATWCPIFPILFEKYKIYAIPFRHIIQYNSKQSRSNIRSKHKDKLNHQGHIHIQYDSIKQSQFNQSQCAVYYITAQWHMSE